MCTAQCAILSSQCLLNEIACNEKKAIAAANSATMTTSMQAADAAKIAKWDTATPAQKAAFTAHYTQASAKRVTGTTLLTEAYEGRAVGIAKKASGLAHHNAGDHGDAETDYSAGCTAFDNAGVRFQNSNAFLIPAAGGYDNATAALN